MFRDCTEEGKNNGISLYFCFCCIFATGCLPLVHAIIQLQDDSSTRPQRSGVRLALGVDQI